VTLPRRRPASLAPLLVAAAVICVACDKPRDTGDPQPTRVASAGGGAPDGGSGLATAGPEAGTRGPARSSERPTSWRGTYKSAAAILYIPDQRDWKGVRFNVNETPAGIGEGTVSLGVDPASGRVTGEVDGPLGPATVEGVSREGQVTAMLRRKDPSDQGFAGTLVGTLDGERGGGTLSVSTGEASAVRSATFVVTPGGAR